MYYTHITDTQIYFSGFACTLFSLLFVHVFVVLNSAQLFAPSAAPSCPTARMRGGPPVLAGTHVLWEQGQQKAN